MSHNEADECLMFVKQFALMSQGRLKDIGFVSFALKRKCDMYVKYVLALADAA